MRPLHPVRMATLVVAAAPIVSCAHKPHAAPQTATQCFVQEESRQLLRLDSQRTIYVEPEALAASNGEVLLVGTPNYIWTTLSDGTRRGEPDRVLGVVLPDTGYAREVSAPIDPARIRTVRAVTRVDGSWAVVFVEIPSPTQTDYAAQLWFGVHDGCDWRRLERIPVPSEGRLNAGIVSTLARGGGDTLALAIPIHVASSRDVAVFIFDGRKWSHELVPVRRAVYAELGFDDGGLVMALVRPDTTLSSDRNSLFLYGREGGWHVRQKVAPGLAAPVHDPALRLDAQNGGMLGWRALVSDQNGQQRWEARVASGPLAGPVAAAPIDSAAEGLIPVVFPDRRSIWVTDHRGSDGNWIRFFTRGRVRMEEIGHVPNAYEGFFGAVALPNGHMVISGPLVERSGETLSSLTSQVIRVAVRCPPAALGQRVRRIDARPRSLTSSTREQ